MDCERFCTSTGINYERTSQYASDGSIHRYYDPTTGQFLSVDPAASITGQPYSYAADDPVNNSDPSGLCVSLFGVVCVGGGPVTSTVHFGFHPGNALKGAANFGAGLANFAVSTLTLGNVNVPAPLQP